MIPSLSLQPLVPTVHRRWLYCFHNPNIDIVKLDFTFEAGSACQWLMSQAHAANQLFGEATTMHSAADIAEFMDFRGIVVERMTDVCQGNISFYFLRKYAVGLFPLLREMFDHPLVTPQLFEVYVGRRRQTIATGFQRTDYMARNRFYELLYGSDHPLGCYATADDLDHLTLDSVVEFQRQHYNLNAAHVVISGNVDEELLSLADSYLAPESCSWQQHIVLPQPHPGQQEHTVFMPSVVQSTIRIGSILPLRWSDMEYAKFMVLSTVLGGYFGSRLISNIREDKGYTYGVYSQTHIYRGSIVFVIATDVAADATQLAVDEIFREVDILRQQPVPEEELERVRNVMMGDFIRSIDGVFEISERYRQMVSTGLTELFSANFLDAIRYVSSAELQNLAQQYFTGLTTVIAGPVGN